MMTSKASAHSQLRIITTGLVGLYPVGGMAWHYLQYLIGLARLGHEVYYHEDTWSWPYHPLENTYTSSGEYSACYLRDFIRRYAPELDGRWHYSHLHETSFGMERSAFDEVAWTADLFLNVSGACMIPDRLSPHCRKVFLDTDPGYNQIMLSERPAWSENIERWCACVFAHDRFFTFAENINGVDCGVPKVDLTWRTTRMPMVLSLWDRVARTPPPPEGPWTTVMTWNPFKGQVIYRGEEFGGKDWEFEKLMNLPHCLDVPVRAAVGGVNAPLDRLARAGWQVVDAPRATVTPGDYQELIAGSRGEISPAKHIYVALGTGWFSERTASYLAAGRPVVVQDTGFSRFLPVGNGLLSFSTEEEAAEAIREVEADYDQHRGAARSVAEECFDSDQILPRLIEEALSSD